MGGGVARPTPEWRKGPIVQRQRQQSASFKIHRAPQRSETCNRLSDVSSQSPKQQPHFFFFSRPPLFPFLPRALGCCREIRSSDKTRRVEGGGEDDSRGETRRGLFQLPVETLVRREKPKRERTRRSTRTKQSRFTLIVLIRASVTIGWFKIIQSLF